MRLLLAVLLSLPVFAQTGVITAIEPRQLPYFGGQFTIRGENLSIPCNRPHGECTFVRLEMDGHRSHLNIVSVAPDRIVVDVGPHEIGPATVRVFREDRSEVVAFDGITFSGDPQTEAVLVPLVMAERPGAFGSRWATSFTGWNGGQSLFDPVGPSGVPALVLRQNRKRAEFDTLHLRVRDINREDTSWGTEIPIVRERDLRLEAVHLIDVPTDPRYRVSLRIYNVAPIESAHDAADYVVEVMPFEPCCTPGFPDQRLVHVGPPSTTTSDGTLTWGTPGYAEINDFLADWRDQIGDAKTVRITIRHLFKWDDKTPPLFWAFASITHNATQHVTLVTPGVRK